MKRKTNMATYPEVPTYMTLTCVKTATLVLCTVMTNTIPCKVPWVQTVGFWSNVFEWCQQQIREHAGKVVSSRYPSPALFSFHYRQTDKNLGCLFVLLISKL